MGSPLNLIWGMMTCIGAATVLCAVGILWWGDEKHHPDTYRPLLFVVKALWTGAGLFLTGSTFLAVRRLSDLFQGLKSLGDLLLMALRM